jgi:hypothetical protein
MENLGHYLVYEGIEALSHLESGTVFMRVRINSSDYTWLCQWGGTVGWSRRLMTVSRDGHLCLDRYTEDPDGVRGTTSIHDGAWHSVACTIDASDSYRVFLYVDGVLETQNTTLLLDAGPMEGALRSFSIGSQASNGPIHGGSKPFDVNDYAVWDTPLDAAAIANLHNGAVGFATYETMLLHLPFDGDTVDQSSFSREPDQDTLTFSSLD